MVYPAVGFVNFIVFPAVVSARITAPKEGKIMSRSRHFVFLAVLLACIAVAPVRAQQRGNAAQAGTAANAERPATPIPPEKNSVTSHEITLSGKTLHYTATAGNLLIQADDEQQ